MDVFLSTTVRRFIAYLDVSVCKKCVTFPNTCRRSGIRSQLSACIFVRIQHQQKFLFGKHVFFSQLWAEKQKHYEGRPWSEATPTVCLEISFNSSITSRPNKPSSGSKQWMHCLQ